MQISGRIPFALQIYVCRIRKYARKPETVELIESLLLGQSLPANYEWADRVGVDRPCGKVSTREVVVIVPALLELYIFGGFLNRGWGPISPVCNKTGWWASIILLGFGGAVELEPISDFSQRRWSFHTVRGGDDPRERGFIYRVVYLLELWTGDGTLPSLGGADPNLRLPAN